MAWLSLAFSGKCEIKDNNIIFCVFQSCTELSSLEDSLDIKTNPCPAKYIIITHPLVTVNQSDHLYC